MGGAVTKMIDPPQCSMVITSIYGNGQKQVSSCKCRANIGAKYCSIHGCPYPGCNKDYTQISIEYNDQPYNRPCNQIIGCCQHSILICQFVRYPGQQCCREPPLPFKKYCYSHLIELKQTSNSDRYMMRRKLNISCRCIVNNCCGYAFPPYVYCWKHACKACPNNIRPDDADVCLSCSKKCSVPGCNCEVKRVFDSHFYVTIRALYSLPPYDGGQVTQPITRISEDIIQPLVTKYIDTLTNEQFLSYRKPSSQRQLPSRQQPPSRRMLPSRRRQPESAYTFHDNLNRVLAKHGIDLDFNQSPYTVYSVIPLTGHLNWDDIFKIKPKGTSVIFYRHPDTLGTAYAFCSKHLCQAKSCPEQRCNHSYYCNTHACSIEGCRSCRQYNQQFCIYHMDTKS